MYVMVYHHWSKLLLVEFTPYVLMIVLNCLIWRRVRAMVRMRYDVGLAAGERERWMDFHRNCGDVMISPPKTC